MKKEEFYFDSRDGKSSIHGVRWMPDKGEAGAKGIIQIVHGMEEYVGRYEDFGEFMTSNGFIVTGEDHLGHGGSVAEGQTKGYFCEQDPATVLVRDVHRLKKITQEKFPGLPMILMGHSMGSFITRNYIYRYGTGIQMAIIMGTGQPGLGAVNVGVALAKLTALFKGAKCIPAMVTKISFGGYTARIPNPRTPYDWLSVNEKNVDERRGAGSGVGADAGRANLTIIPARKEGLSVEIVKGQETPVVQGWVPTKEYDVRAIPTPIYTRKVSGSFIEPYILYPLADGEANPVQIISFADNTLTDLPHDTAVFISQFRNAHILLPLILFAAAPDDIARRFQLQHLGIALVIHKHSLVLDDGGRFSLGRSHLNLTLFQRGHHLALNLPHKACGSADGHGSRTGLEVDFRLLLLLNIKMDLTRMNVQEYEFFHVVLEFCTEGDIGTFGNPKGRTVGHVHDQLRFQGRTHMVVFHHGLANSKLSPGIRLFTFHRTHDTADLCLQKGILRNGLFYRGANRLFFGSGLGGLFVLTSRKGESS